MVRYAKNELLSITDFTKKIGSIVKDVKNNAIEKIGILKNNSLEAVLISTEEYERLKHYEEMMEKLEDEALIKMAEKRASMPFQSISHSEMLKRLDIPSEALK